ncbi:hypothetical protein [Streptomyces sp. enrichment culture]|uniref:hypothetical protein n=1 Tax=Streptomyces sp. enrichment culture TaxID=1795815 RepID=UPI003F568902
MAVVLYLSDLETLSWLAGAGSFATAVPSLMLAVLLARTPPPPPPAVTPGQQTGSSDTIGSAVFELTTFAIRLRVRASAALREAVKGVAFLWCLAALMLVMGKLQQFTTGEGLKVSALLALVIMVGLPVAAAVEAADGRDVLVVNTDGLTVIDQRHCRIDGRHFRPKDESFSIRWDELSGIRLVVDPEGGAYSLCVTFEDSSHGVERSIKHGFLEKNDGSHVVGRLLLGSAVAERTALLPPLRTALTRYGGGKFQG